MERRWAPKACVGSKRRGGRKDTCGSTRNGKEPLEGGTYTFALRGVQEIHTLKKQKSTPLDAGNG